MTASGSTHPGDADEAGVGNAVAVNGGYLYLLYIVKETLG